LRDKFSNGSSLQINAFTSEQIFRAALKNMSVSIFVLDTELRYMWINNPPFGQSGKELKNKKVSEMSKLKGASDLINFYCEVLKTGLPRKEEFKLEFEDKVAFYEIYASPLKNSSGKVMGLVVSSTDVTHHKKAEQELWRAKKDWERTFDSVPDLVTILDNKFRIVHANRAMAQQLGVTPEKAIGLFCYQCVHGSDKPLEFCPHTQTVKDGKEHMAEVHEPRLGGDFLVTTTPLKDEGGRIIGSVHVARNITDLKKAEEALRENEKRLNRSQEIAHLGSWELDLVSNRLSWSDEVYRIFGLKPQEFSGTYEAFLEAVHPDDRSAVDAAYACSLREGKEAYEIEHRIVRKSNGEIRVVYDKWEHVRDKTGKIIRSIGMVQDITERVKAEEEIWQAAERNQLYLEAGGLGASEYNFKTGSSFWDENARRMLGMERETAIKQGEENRRIHPEDKLAIEEAVDQALSGANDGTYRSEFRVVLPDNSIRWLTSRGQVFFEGEGRNRRPSRVICVYMDITERKKADEYLQKQAELIDLSPDAIIVKRLDDTITFWSRGAEKLYGWTKNEAIGQRTSSLLKTKSSEAFKDVILKLKQTGNWSGELTQYAKDGKELVVQSWWLGKPDEQGKINEILESNSDVTERIRTQVKLEENARLLEEYANQMEDLADERARQLKKNERLAAIGQTAGMVGHDIRNPLQAIVGELYLAKEEIFLFPDSASKKNLQESFSSIEENLFYIDKIVADLQDYTKPLKPNREKVNVEKVIEEALLVVYIPNNLQVSISIEDGFPQLTADFSMLKRALINLIQNAVQAMPKGGFLNITAKCKGKHAYICVEDTGEGIPEEVKDKLFTPLFTTKAKGQGFGLAVVKRLVEGQSGKISFESEQGKGTTFTIQLPLT